MKTKYGKEQALINDFEKKRIAYDKAEDDLKEHFNEIADEMAKTAVTPEDFIEIKKRMIPMPQCASKVLLFRKLILLEEMREREKNNN